MRRPNRFAIAAVAAGALFGCFTALTGTGSAADADTELVSVVAMNDAHVRNGSTADVNYGRSPVLKVKTDSVYGYSREAYLTFPIPGPAEPERAVLRLNAQLQKGTLGLAAHQVMAAPDEAAVTWDHRPAFGAPLAHRTITGTAKQVIELDVTAAVRSARDADQDTVTIGLRGTTSGEPLLDVDSREASSGRPVLVATMASTPTSTTTTTGAPPSSTTTTAPTTTMPTTTMPTTTTTTPTTTTTTTPAPPGVRPTILSVVATGDAHARDGASSATNYGGSPTLEVKADGVAGASREAYLTFPVPGMFDPRRAVLRLTVLADQGSVDLAVHRVATAPNQLAVNWEHRPPFGALASSRTITGKAGAHTVDLDVTAAVAAARAAGERTVTFGLRAATAQSPLLVVSTRESSTGKPLLVLQNP